MYEYLKQLFGTAEDGSEVSLTFTQLAEKLNNSKDVKLINLNDGGYVAKEKFTAKETELTGLKEQLETANVTIKSYKDMDVEGIKRSATKWEEKYKTDTAALTQKLADQERAFNEDKFLSNFKFSSKAAEAGIRAEFKAKNFTYDNGTFLGANEFMESLKSSDDYKAAFITETPSDPNNKPKPQFGNGEPGKPAPPPKMSLTELMKQANENPNAEIKFE